MQNNSYKKMFKHIYQFICSWLMYVILFQATINYSNIQGLS